jgi:hypothetical protein
VGEREPVRCRVCGTSSPAPLCSVTCRAAARDEIARNQARIDRLRELGFDARLDEVQAVVRRNAELTQALDDPTLVDTSPASR